MGSSIKIQDSNLDITKFTCSLCQQKFTDQDKENDNWDLWWDTSHDANLEPDGQWYLIKISVRDITHKVIGNVYAYNCPSTHRCRGCYQQFPTKELKELNDYYFCQPCWEKEPTNHE